MQTLDFNKVKKEYFVVTLNDEQKTKLQIMTPTKRMLSELLETIPSFVNGEIPSAENIAFMYDMCAKLMSRNRTGTQITGDQLAEILDFEDLTMFFEAYTNFITERSQSKN